MIAVPSLASSQFLGSRIAFPRRPPIRSVAFVPTRIAAASAQFAPAAERQYSSPAAPSLYEVLGVAAGATGKEIKAAYRTLALSCHPDVSDADSSADEFMRIHAAYSTLSDPGKRADYDRGLFVLRHLRRRTPPFSGGPRRTWETDQCW